MSIKISVVIPAYNAEKYIVETLESIRNQTVQPGEVIIIDDGSTDNTVQVVEDYINKTGYSIIKIHKSKFNGGIGMARQKGVNIARTSYIAYLSADDCYAPTFIEHSLALVKPNTATYTSYYQCNSLLESQHVFRPPDFSRTSIIKWALEKNMYVNFSSIILPIWIFDKVTFEGSLRHGEDLIFLLDTVIAGLQWRLVDEPLLFYRIHNKAGSFTQKREEFELLWRYLRLRLQALDVPHQLINEAYKKSCRHAYPWYPRRLVSKLYHKVMA
jgi:glycosyltransferase involved in cell wall biosynthesis